MQVRSADASHGPTARSSVSVPSRPATLMRPSERPGFARTTIREVAPGPSSTMYNTPLLRRLAARPPASGASRAPNAPTTRGRARHGGWAQAGGGVAEGLPLAAAGGLATADGRVAVDP